jgi:hypothetical protein
VTSPDVAAPRASTGLVEENTSFLQAASPNSRNVTEPVGTNAPTRVAVSPTAVPTGPPGEGAARIEGARLPIVIVNVWQAVGASSLTTHTVVGPKVPATSGAPVMNPTSDRRTPGGRAPAVTEYVVSTLGGLTENWWRYPLPTTPTGGGGLVMAAEVCETACGEPSTGATTNADTATSKTLDRSGSLLPAPPWTL